MGSGRGRGVVAGPGSVWGRVDLLEDTGGGTRGGRSSVGKSCVAVSRTRS